MCTHTLWNVIEKLAVSSCHCKYCTTLAEMQNTYEYDVCEKSFMVISNIFN